jgi:predicted phage tail protein
LVMVLTSTQWPLSSNSSAAVTLKLKTESQIKSESALYDAALREITRIETLKLKTPEDSKIAEDILEQQVSNLRFGRSKLIAMGLSDSTFVNAVKAKVYDKKSADQFAQELAKDSAAILKLPGAAAVRDQIRKKADADANKLQSIVRKLKEEEARKRNEANLDASAIVPTAPIKVIAAAIIVSILVAVAIIVSVNTLGAALALVVVAAAGASATAAALAAGAAAVVAGVEEVASNVPSEEKIAACQDKADTKYKNCKSKANKLWEPVRSIERGHCRADWLFDAAVCLATD